MRHLEIDNFEKHKDLPQLHAFMFVLFVVTPAKWRKERQTKLKIDCNGETINLKQNIEKRKLKDEEKKTEKKKGIGTVDPVFVFLFFFLGGGLVLSIRRGECFNDRQWNSKSIARTTVSFSFHHLHIKNYLFCYHFLVGYAHWNLNM